MDDRSEIFDFVAEECALIHLKGDTGFGERGENLIEMTDNVLH